MADLESEVPKVVKLEHDGQANHSEYAFNVEFWGVRDQIPTSGQDTIIYGGNTACVEVCVGRKRLIFDGGTGLRNLGNKLLPQMPIKAHLLFTNCHWDRIQGFPFFVPAFVPINNLYIYGTNGVNGCSFQECLRNQMLSPNFPVPMEVMGSQLNFYHLQAGENRWVEDLTINTCLLNAVTNSIGYRVNWQSHALVYATACNYDLPNLAKNLKVLAQDADLLIINAPQDHQSPHLSTAWQKVFELLNLVAVKQIVISNHDPGSDDDYLDSMQTNLQAVLPHGTCAYEGMVIQVA